MAEKKRGRPPTGKAMSDAERARKYRATRRAKVAPILATGGKQLKLVLDRDSVDALLVCIGTHQGMTASEIVGNLLKREAGYLQGVEGELLKNNQRKSRGP